MFKIEIRFRFLVFLLKAEFFESQLNSDFLVEAYLACFEVIKNILYYKTEIYFVKEYVYL